MGSSIADKYDGLVIYSSSYPSFITIEGNYGAGKTLLVDLVTSRLKSRTGLCTLGYGAVPELYEANQYLEDQSRQVRVNFKKMAQGIRAAPEPIFALCQNRFLDLDKTQKGIAKLIVTQINCVDDRSVEGDALYMENFYRLGWVNEEEIAAYRSKYAKISASKPKPILRVYLRVDPLLLHEVRIPGRGRDFEKGIPLEYIVSLDETHEDWIAREQKKAPDSVLIIDNGPHINLKDSRQDQTGVLEQIRDRLQYLNKPQYH